MSLNIDFNIDNVLEKYSEDNIQKMYDEINLQPKPYELTRLITTEINLCQGYSKGHKCNKNAVYMDIKNNDKLICWWHALELKMKYNEKA